MKTYPVPAREDHCSNCGRSCDPFYDATDGYSDCCNDRVCDGRGSDRFGTPSDFVTACCWAKADDKFAAEGRTAPDGSSRLF